MKIAFDENIPHGMVEVFQALAAAGSILDVEIRSARQYRPAGEKGDEHWVRRFAKDGGAVIISGDERMRTLAHERAALSDTGMITFQFESRWSNANGFVKCAMLLNWWPRIMETVALAKPGDCYQVPFQWNWTTLRNVTPPLTTPRPRRPR